VSGGIPPAFLAAAATAEPALRELLAGSPARGRLAEAMSYAVLGPGKRLRPALAQVAGAVVDGRGLRALPLGLAIEVFHASTLVHDDLPALDDDDLRRGRPACHRAFDEAVALLTGDALMILPFQILAEFEPGEALEPSARLAAIQRLARAAGAWGVVGGQALELVASGQDLPIVHDHKTAALFVLAAAGGALCCGGPAPVVAALEGYGLALGRLFQLTDDLLDLAEGEDDPRELATSLAASLGPAAAALRCDELVAQGLAALEPVREWQAAGALVPQPGAHDALASLADLLRYVRRRTA